MAFELDANRPMELKPAVLPSSLSKSTPNLTTTLNRPLHSGRTYDGYAASWTGDSNDNGAATGDVVVKVAQPAFDTGQYQDFEPTEFCQLSLRKRLTIPPCAYTLRLVCSSRCSRDWVSPHASEVYGWAMASARILQQPVASPRISSCFSTTPVPVCWI